MRLRLLALLTAVLVVAGAGTADARPRGLTIGFYGDPVLTGDTAATRAEWIPRAVAEGAGMVRVNIDWSQVAPTTRPAGFSPTDPSSPGYNWTAVDAAVRDLTSHGLKVLISITFAPKWAEGPDMPSYAQPGTWRPNPTQFADFAIAAARRYDGSFDGLPRVRYWQPWNEPNLDYYLSPQWTRAGNGWTPTSPDVYRQLLNSFYAAVKSVASSNFVVSGGTAPYGDPPGADPAGEERMPPVQFYRYLFCLKDNRRLTPYSCPDPPHLDAIDHHPYGIGGPLWHAVNRDDVAVPDIDKLSRVLHAAERDGHVLPHGSKQLWVTEVSWDSNPPNPGGVPIEEQARWLEQALYVLWKQGVDTVLWIQIIDQPCIPNCGTTSQAGLYYVNGTAKPAAQAFRFPFVTQRLNRRHVLAWGRAPEGGRLAIEVRRHGRWVVIRRLRVKTEQVFTASLRISGKALLRAQVAGLTSLTWTQPR
jgi:hypothetical protein